MNKPAFLINFNPERDDRSSQHWAMWELLAKSFDFDLAVYTLGVPLVKYPVAVSMTFNDIPEAQRWLPASEWVFLASPISWHLDQVKLCDFDHQEGAVYVLGPEYEDWDIAGCHIDHAVRVETPHGTEELHTFTVASIVAYDIY